MQWTSKKCTKKCDVRAEQLLCSLKQFFFLTLLLSSSLLKVPNNKASPIQLFRERLSEKVHATIPKGIVGGF